MCIFTLTMTISTCHVSYAIISLSLDSGVLRIWSVYSVKFYQSPRPLGHWMTFIWHSKQPTDPVREVAELSHSLDDIDAVTEHRAGHAIWW